jgi:hypothetical protein
METRGCDCSSKVLLMMPKTCWAAFTRLNNKRFYNWVYIWLVVLFEYLKMHGTTNHKLIKPPWTWNLIKLYLYWTVAHYTPLLWLLYRYRYIFNNGSTLDGTALVISKHKCVLSWHKHALFYFSIPAVCFSCKQPFSGSPFKLGVNQHKYTLPIYIMMGWCVT